MKTKKNDHIISVCITGDMDYLKIENIEDCLVPIFTISRKYNAYTTKLVAAKAAQGYRGRLEHMLKEWHEIFIYGDVHPSFCGSMAEKIDWLEKGKQIYHETLRIISIGLRAPYMCHNQNTFLAPIATGFTCDSSCARNEYNSGLSVLNRCFSEVSYPETWN